jgi:hypothetical protein
LGDILKYNLLQTAKPHRNGREKKGDNNGDICSYKKRAHKTHTFERKVAILKRIDNVVECDVLPR